MTTPDEPTFSAREDLEKLRGTWQAQEGLVSQENAQRLRTGAGMLSPDDPMVVAATASKQSFTATQETLTSALDAEPKLFADNNTDPIALLPLRIETVWFTADGQFPSASGHPPTLRVRVYPDDLLMAQLDTTLTVTEADAADGYWTDPGPDAWQGVLTRLRPDRAAWAVHAKRPGAPAPVIRPDGSDRPPQSFRLPKRLRFIAFTDDKVVADAAGRPIPDPLPLDVLQSETSWVVHWFTALVNGMAVELSLPEGIDHVDALYAVGVCDESASAGAEQLQTLLQGHAFSAGLGFLKAGTPTNNTSSTRSAWSSAPTFPDPADQPGPAERPRADSLRAALGLPDTDLLTHCSNAADPEPEAVAALSLLTWPTLGAGFAEAAASHISVTTDPGAVTAVDSQRPWRSIREHLTAHVRSRGPLPMIRVGRQPYGVLPVSSLSDWKTQRADDPDALLLDWLLRLRGYWRAALDVPGVPAIGAVDPDHTPEQVMVDMLSRTPTATAISVTRMSGPTETLAAVAGGAPPSSLTLAGLPPDSALWWTAPAPTPPTPPAGASPPPDLVDQLTAGHQVFSQTAAATADYFHTVRTFLAGGLSAQDYDATWPVDRGDGQPRPRRSTFIDVVGIPEGLDVLEALVCIRNWFPLAADDDALAHAFMVTGDVDQIVIDIVDTGADRTQEIAAAAQSSASLADIEAALRALAALPIERVADLAMEVIDIYSHRLDAWITSLANARLHTQRIATPTGIRIGAYGWVENLAPMAPRDTIAIGQGKQAIVSQQDGYIHAPSLQQATTAAVLRSGSLSHPGEDTYSVNLNSRRARTARWLIGGVRAGQTLGTLLGYRFERALHDAHLDTELDNFRRNYPTPSAGSPQTGTDPAEPSAEIIAARNVVDGMKLALDPDAVATAAADNRTAVEPIVRDLTDALDAVSDLLLAESVHHLVGGNPMRAGLTADTMGRGTDVPDTFDTLTTPHRALALTNRLAALLPAGAAATGWPADDLSALAPELEAWAAHLLGPADGWTLTGTPTSEPVTLDRLQMGALTTVLDASSAAYSALGSAYRTVTGAHAGDPVTFSGPGWDGLRGLAKRIRTLLTNAAPLLPAHLPDADSRHIDMTGVQQRLLAFAALPAVAADPAGPALHTAAAAGTDDPIRWLANAKAALAPVLGTDIPLLPVLSGTPPTARTDAQTAELDGWLVRYAQIRDTARTFYETLLLAGLRGRRCETLCAAQDPSVEHDKWVGSVYEATTRPDARTHLVWHQSGPTTLALTGMIFDEWVELLPGADQIRQVQAGVPPLTSPEESELTGIAFHYDRPDAKAPQALLIAVPPNLERGWTPDTLVQVLRETMELGKLRAVDTADLQSLHELLPAIRIPAVNNAAGNVLAALVGASGDGHDDSPFRLEPSHRTPERVDTGLAARVHDPLWLLTRQWQFGEFGAQDAGSPSVVTFHGASAHLNAWRPVGADAWVPYDPATTPLDVLVEAEPQPAQPDERRRVEAGAQFRARLADAGKLDELGSQLSAMAMRIDGADDSMVGLVAALGGVVPDPDALALAIQSGGFEQQGLGPLAAQWGQWWSELREDHRPDCFDPTRFEHAVELSAGGVVLRAGGYLGDGFDWYCVDVDPDTAAATAAAPYTFKDEALPSVVRYPGLPADRFWEMEDAQIDLGATDVSALDTGRLLLISFATVYGNDWFLAPLEVPIGSLTTLDQMLVRDVFDRLHVINRAGRDDPTWSMYTLDSPDPDHWAATAMLMMPSSRGHIGEPLEHVGLTRDELANLGWAVQHRITDTRGQLVDCRGVWLQNRPPPEEPGALPTYRVQTSVPSYWYPLVAVGDAPGVIHFALAQVSTESEGTAPAPQPLGHVLSNMSWLHEEELPRDGAALSRRPVLARWFDGSWYSWVRRQKSPGTGESSSGLTFDSVWPTDPWPL